MVLAKMRETAEQYLNTKVKWVAFLLVPSRTLTFIRSHAAITVPAYFNDAQRHVLRVINDACSYLKVHNIIHAIATSEDPADAGGYWSGLARNSGALNNRRVFPL
jgi:hypothetical protein